LLQYVAFGIVTGGFLLLATIGFALTSRVERFLNIAHAELISVGALGTWFLSARVGLPVWLAAICAVALAAVLGLLIARTIYDPLFGRDSSILLITSVGVVFFLGGVIEAIIGPGFHTIRVPALPAWQLGSVRVNPYQVGVLVVGLASVAFLHLFLTRTRIGIFIRALTDDRTLAEARGVDVRRTTRYVWLVASALAGLAGVALGLIGTITSEIAFQQILLILTVSIVAGLGNIYGVAIAAFVIGIAMDMSVLWLPGGYRTAVAFAAVIVVLSFRREGLAGEAHA
jgi:branched-chain amino acid transport system permease protein